jgi:hypothetical protein
MSFKPPSPGSPGFKEWQALADLVDDAGVLGGAAHIERPWHTVAIDGNPPCDGHTTFIGINSAGYACCFNAMRGGMCVMETPEGAYRQMSDLRDWRLLDRPSSAVGNGVLRTPETSDGTSNGDTK